MSASLGEAAWDPNGGSRARSFTVFPLGGGLFDVMIGSGSTRDVMPPRDVHRLWGARKVASLCITKEKWYKNLTKNQVELLLKDWRNRVDRDGLKRESVNFKEAP